LEIVCERGKTMAFMGRGEVPSINFGNNSNDNNTN